MIIIFNFSICLSIVLRVPLRSDRSWLQCQRTPFNISPTTILLTEVDDDKGFLCDGCRTLGCGTRYRCHDCDFDLHEQCGACPTVFSSFLHPQHNLTLGLYNPQTTKTNQNFHSCDVCGDLADGMFYRCQICDFDVHPIFTKLPEHVSHVMHPNHRLKLQSFHPGLCMVCKGMCKSWCYRCELCCFDLHLECVLAPCNMSTPRFAPPPPPLALPPQPPPSSCSYVALPRPPYAYRNPSLRTNNFNPYAPEILPPSSSRQVKGDRNKKIMYNIAGKLALGVLSDMNFGYIFS